MATRSEIDAAIADSADVDKADLRAILKEGVQDDFADVASASTVDLGAEASSNLRITGTTTITSFGTATAGTWRWLRFAGALTLTHNATALILPGAANITTVAADRALAISLGSGNWVVMSYVGATNAQAQAVIGGTATGQAVFGAASASAARSAISAPAIPTETSGAGKWEPLASTVGGALALSAGGTWAWFTVSITNSSATYSASDSGVDAGGTTVASASTGILHIGFAWRIS